MRKEDKTAQGNTSLVFYSFSCYSGRRFKYLLSRCGYFCGYCVSGGGRHRGHEYFPVFCPGENSLCLPVAVTGLVFCPGKLVSDLRFGKLFHFYPAALVYPAGGPVIHTRAPGPGRKTFVLLPHPSDADLYVRLLFPFYPDQNSQ